MREASACGGGHEGIVQTSPTHCSRDPHQAGKLGAKPEALQMDFHNKDRCSFCVEEGHYMFNESYITLQATQLFKPFEVSHVKAQV